MLGGGLAWIESGSRSEGGETGKTCLRPWALSEPRDQAVDIDGGSDRDVLQVGLCHAPVPGPAQAKGADPLRQRPLDTSSPLIELLALFAGSPGLRRLQRLVLVLGWQPQAPAGVLGTGTGGPYGTCPTRALIKFDNDGATALATPMLPPRH